VEKLVHDAGPAGQVPSRTQDVRRVSTAGKGDHTAADQGRRHLSTVSTAPMKTMELAIYPSSDNFSPGPIWGQPVSEPLIEHPTSTGVE